jgi:hypothetical protein
MTFQPLNPGLFHQLTHSVSKVVGHISWNFNHNFVMDDIDNLEPLCVKAGYSS